MDMSLPEGESGSSPEAWHCFVTACCSLSNRHQTSHPGIQTHAYGIMRLHRALLVCHDALAVCTDTCSGHGPSAICCLVMQRCHATHSSAGRCCNRLYILIHNDVLHDRTFRLLNILLCLIQQCRPLQQQFVFTEHRHQDNRSAHALMPPRFMVSSQRPWATKKPPGKRSTSSPCRLSGPVAPPKVGMPCNRFTASVVSVSTCGHVCYSSFAGAVCKLSICNLDVAMQH